jgi:hypothetical protein
MRFHQNLLGHLIRAGDSGNAHPTLRRQRQFTAVLFTKCCAMAGIEVSMGRSAIARTTPSARPSTPASKRRRSSGNPTRPEPRRAPLSFGYIEGWYNPRRRHSTLGYLSPIEFERNHTELAQLALEAPISPNGSVASIAPKASHGLTTRCVSTIGVDFADRAPISPENGLVIPTGPSRAATGGGQRTNGSGWPLRPEVTEQAR